MLVRKNKNENSIGLVGDGDEVELVTELESVFNISISDNEAKQIVNLGDAFELICSKLPSDEGNQVKCMSSMAYHRLNRALSKSGRVNPKSRIEIPPSISPRSFQKHLELQSGLRLEFLTRASIWFDALTLVYICAWPSVAFALFFDVLNIYLCVSVISMFHVLWRFAARWDNRKWMFEGTLAELSMQATTANFGKLVAAGGSGAAPKFGRG